ncbi:MAG: DUF2956 domain-containing protein [Arenicellales bacterium]
MAKYSRTNKISPQTQDEAMKITRGIQKPGQTKEQSKLIAQGIQKGIDQYKKQYRAKERELDKKLKKVALQPHLNEEIAPESTEVVKYRQSLLPWILLLMSWVLFGIYVQMT